jgi:glycosyltransferase involved in cell wall biosynthesis
MKILFISNIFTPHVRGGYELGCQTIANEYQKNGHEVSIATSRVFGKLYKSNLDHSLDVRQIFEPVLAYEESNNNLNNIYSKIIRNDALAGSINSNNLALVNFITQYQPEFVWLFNPLGLGPIGIVETLLSLKIPFCIHLMENIDGVIRDHQPYTHSYSKWARLKKESYAISCSSFISQINQHYTSYKVCKLIPNGVRFPHINQYTNKITKNNLEKEFHIVYFGQVAVKKGILQSIRAVKQLKDQRPDLVIKFEIYGSGDPSFVESINNLITKLDIEKVVFLAGTVRQSDLFERIRDADLAIMLLSSDEPFAYAPIEATALGLPVVLPKNVSNASYFPDDYGLLIDNRDDFTEIANKISKHADTVKKRQLLSNQLFKKLKYKLDLEESILPSYDEYIN